MSRRASAVLSWLSSFAVAYLVGSKLRDRRTATLAALTAATIAATVSWVVAGVAEASERREASTTDTVQNRPETRGEPVRDE